jgi:hypothetical protein
MKCLLILVDSCQPAYLGCYGNDWLATPTLDGLAAQGIVFDQHFAASGSPKSMRWSWLTGQFPSSRSIDSGMSLAIALWDEGVKTALIADGASPSLDTRWARDWEEVRWIRTERLAELEQDSRLGATVQAAIEWLRVHGPGDNWLLTVELAALWPPWEPETFDAEALEGHDEEELEPFFNPRLGPLEGKQAERAAATYAGVVSGVDQWLGMLFDAMRKDGVFEETLIILTSDLGLPLGEHGTFGPYPARLHEELVHLPLLIRLPQGQEAGRRVQQFTQSVDLQPTVLDAFGLKMDSSVHGKSLLPAARNEGGNVREYACCFAREEWSIRTHGWYLRLPRDSAEAKPRLFIKPEDRWEANDVAGLHPDVVEHLELTLRRFHAATRSSRLEAAPELRHDVLNVAHS